MHFTGGNSGAKNGLRIPASGLRFRLMKLASIGTGATLMLSLFSMFLLLTARPAQAHTETVLYNFTDGSDGAYPEQTLTSDHAGNFYGTTLPEVSDTESYLSFRRTVAGGGTRSYSTALPEGRTVPIPVAL